MHAHIIGDLHGYYDTYEYLLKNTGLIDANCNWTGGNDQLWLIGDIFDRGSEAAKCIELTMKLAKQAETVGGVVSCILGNHELMFLAARLLMDEEQGKFVYQQWQRWGGQSEEMGNITDEHVEWLKQLPAMKLVGDRLLIHSDNLSYVNYGMTIDQVNTFFSRLMESRDPKRWFNVLQEFSQRGGFELSLTGKKQANQLLKLYGGEVLVHGHTPISLALGIEAETVTSARVYADGVCCNVDGGIYLGGPGFVYSFEM